MKLFEIKVIHDNAFEKLKDSLLYDSVDVNYRLLKKLSELNPNQLAVDVLGDEIEDYRSVVYFLLEKVKKVYMPSDNIYLRVAEMWKYLNQ